MPREELYDSLDANAQNLHLLPNKTLSHKSAKLHYQQKQAAVLWETKDVKDDILSLLKGMQRPNCISDPIRGPQHNHQL